MTASASWVSRGSPNLNFLDSETSAWVVAVLTPFSDDEKKVDKNRLDRLIRE